VSAALTTCVTLSAFLLAVFATAAADCAVFLPPLTRYNSWAESCDNLVRILSMTKCTILVGFATKVQLPRATV
jgi:hypothetical protein